MKKRLAGVAAVLAIVGMVAFLCREKPVEGDAVSLPRQVTAAKVQAAAKPAAPASVGFLDGLPTNQTASVRGTKPFVLTSEESFQRPLRLAAEALGARTVGVLSANELLVEADVTARRRLVASRKFKTVSEFLPSAKVAPELAALVKSGAKTVEAVLVTLAPEDRLAVKARVVARGGEVLTGCMDFDDNFRAKMPAELVAELSGYGDVRWMEVFTRPHLMNDIAVNAEAMNVRAIWKTSEDDLHGLSGEGQLISTSDSGIDTGNLTTLHDDLRDRVLDIKVVDGCNNSDRSGHGTHTAGSIVGNGKMSDGQIRGTAWGAHLYAWFSQGSDGYIYLPKNPHDLFRNNGEWWAFIHSASWGSSQYGTYTSESALYDKYVWAHPDFLPVFSAGNDGEDGGTSIGSPATAKNLLTVGATQNLRTEPKQAYLQNGNPEKVAEYSSRGPCLDGRIKPDVASPGTGVLSTRAYGINYSFGIYNDYYAYDTGTSMACPLTAGAVALVREWLLRREEFEDDEAEFMASKRPTAALMKAVIMGGAKGVRNPDNNLGWGRTDLAETLYPSNRAIKIVDRIPYEAGEKISWLFEVTNAAPLDVQLVWVDYPGTASSQSVPKLINDLDLTVEPVSAGTVYYGNGGAKPDTRNNAESVRFDLAEPGWYRVTVDCKKVLYDHNDGGAAAIYMRGAFDPEAFKSSLDRVRIRETELCYITLVDALIAGAPEPDQPGPTFEILQPVELPYAWTVGYDCTICSTNDDPRLTPIAASASLGVGKTSRVLFTNVVFTGESPSICVLTNGTAALAGTVDVKGIELKGDGVVEIAGDLDESCFYKVTAEAGHNGLGETFGIASVDLETAKKCAKLFMNGQADELVGEAFKDGDGTVRLRWVVGDIPDAAAVARLVQDGASIKFASLGTLLKYVTNAAEIVVLKDCPLNGTLALTNRAVTIRSELENGVVVTPEGGKTAFGSIALGAGGKLTVSNVVFSGFAQFGKCKAFAVVGGGAEFTLRQGAELRGIYNAPYGAVIVEKNGEMTMEAGSAISDCTADEATGNDGWGGGIYLREEAKLALAGGSVTGCRAGKCGGGVYVNARAKVTLSGATAVARNVRGSGVGSAPMQEDDIFIDSTTAMPLTVADGMSGAALGGSIGVLRKEDENNDYGDVEGTEFANLAEGMTDDEKKSAAGAFFSDAFHDYFTGLVGSVEPDEGKTLVWAQTTVRPGSVPERQGKIRVEIGDETVYFASLSAALSAVRTNETALATLLDRVLIDADTSVKGDVTLTGGEFGVYRWDNYRITVSGKGNVLRLADIEVYGVYYNGATNSTCTLFRSEDGGSLVLDDGAWIGALSGFSTESRTSAAVSVRDGLLTMKDGSTISDCKPYEEEYVCAGGGVIVSGTNAVFRFEGGTITACKATTGGGVQIENGAKFIVSGGGSVVDNDESNLYVADLSKVILADNFTGSIGHTLGIRGEFTDPSVFGEVSEDYAESVTNLVPGAAKFFKDEDPEITGCIVTNDTKALLVWSDSVGDDGVWSDMNGNRYGLVTGETPPEPPEPPDPPEPPEPDPQWTVVTNYPTPIAFKSIERVSDTEWALVITDRVEFCNYRLIYTDDLTKGFTTTGDWEHAVGPAAEPVWSTNVITTGGAWFWRAEGTEGTNMVPPQVEN